LHDATKDCNITLGGNVRRMSRPQPTARSEARRGKASEPS